MNNVVTTLVTRVVIRGKKGIADLGIVSVEFQFLRIGLYNPPFLYYASLCRTQRILFRGQSDSMPRDM